MKVVSGSFHGDLTASICISYGNYNSPLAWYPRESTAITGRIGLEWESLAVSRTIQRDRDGSKHSGKWWHSATTALNFWRFIHHPPEFRCRQKPEQGRNAEKETLRHAAPGSSHNQPFAVLAIAVLGVVYGDIGTSPIYALRECFAGKNPIPISPDNVLGILSLILWSLILVISLKYMIFVLRADNRGEGGTFALLALLRPDQDQDRLRRRVLILLGVLGASMLYGGAMITPAISVLSAVEGLEVAAPHLDSYVIPITVAILVALFAVQRHGTAKVGAVFGPLMLIWFAVLAVLGIRGILHAPQVLLAVDPRYAIEFFVNNGMLGYAALYAVFLVTTGGEALYADLGHFGRQPIRNVWFAFVLPALLLNYFGQGALLLAGPSRGVHPFYHLAPSWGLYPLIILATAATCIASQAVITGAYSLTRQAVQLGLLPRLAVAHTSAESHGQIYMPAVNWLLLVAAIALVLVFQSSGNLAAAYGVAVNSTMVITTVLAFNVARERGNWSLPASLALLMGFLTIDLGYLGSNLLTIPHGGWLPLVFGAVLFTVMVTWRRGAILLAEQIEKTTVTLETFIGRLEGEQVPRIPGTAIFFTGRLEETPPALGKLVQHTGVLHERVILVSVVIEPVPKVDRESRIELKALDAGFYRVVLRYGFMQSPNIPSELAACGELGLTLDLDEVHYFIGQVDLLAGRKLRGMALWRTGSLCCWREIPGCHRLLSAPRRPDNDSGIAGRHLTVGQTGCRVSRVRSVERTTSGEMPARQGGTAGSSGTFISGHSRARIPVHFSSMNLGDHDMNNFEQQLHKMKSQPGFIAALDQSGGSTPKALALYGIDEDAWSNDEEMFTIVHEMRTRIITSPGFTGERILGAILFENTMDREIEGQPTADYLWNVKQVVPFLKVDKGLAAEKDGVQLMKPMPGLAALLDKARAKRIFGTKMRSVIKQANPAGIEGHREPAVRSRARRSSPRASCRSSSRKWISTARKRPRPKSCSKRPSSRSSTPCQPANGSCSSSHCRNRTTSTPIVSGIPILQGGCVVRRIYPGRGRRAPAQKSRRRGEFFAGAARGIVGPANR